MGTGGHRSGPFPNRTDSSGEGCFARVSPEVVGGSHRVARWKGDPAAIRPEVVARPRRAPHPGGRPGQGPAPSPLLARWLRSRWKLLLFLAIALGLYARWYYVNPGATMVWTLNALRGLLSLLFAITFAVIQFIAIFWFLSRTHAYWIQPGETGVSFADYRGNPEVLEQARRIVTLLRGVKAFKEMGGEVSRGMLLTGPPGTGKSYLAQVIANEAGLPFGYLSAASLTSMFFGVGNLRVMSMYRKARRLAEEHGAAILFLDEFDAIATARTRQGGAGFPLFGGGSLVLNELLLQMDPPRVETRLWARFLRVLGLRPKPASIPLVFTMAASVTGDTPVLVRRGGRAQWVPIASLADPYYPDGEGDYQVAVEDGLEVLGYAGRDGDPSRFGRAQFVRVRAVFRHKVDHVYEIRYQGGIIRATGNHSVFVVRPDGTIGPKRVDELTCGDHLIRLRRSRQRRAARPGLRTCAVAMAGAVSHGRPHVGGLGHVDGTGMWDGQAPPARRPARAAVLSVTRIPYDGYVYDLCGCDNEAFFGGSAPVLLHNTNVPEALDPALLRPGRFDRKIVVDAPDFDGRKDVVAYYLSKVAHDPALDAPAMLDRLSADLVGATPAVIKHVINEAVVKAHFEGRRQITYEDIAYARELHEWGLKQPIKSMSEDERRRLAYHEAGHAVAQLKLLPHERLLKTTIIRHGRALGLSATRPITDRHTLSQEELMAQIQVALASRAAEELFLGTRLSGVVSDLEQATRLAMAYIGWYGMDGTLYSYAAFGTAGPDDELKARINRLLLREKAKVTEFLQQHAPLVHAVARGLLEKSELTGDQIAELARLFDAGRLARDGTVLPAQPTSSSDEPASSGETGGPLSAAAAALASSEPPERLRGGST